MIALLPVAILLIFAVCTFTPFLVMGRGRRVVFLLGVQVALSMMLMTAAALWSGMGPITTFLLGPGCAICALYLLMKRLLRSD